MADILRLIWGTLADFFRSRADLQTEIIALRHQLNVLRRKRPERLVFGNADRLLLVWLYRLAPGTLNALSIVKPETGSAGISKDFGRSGAENPGRLQGSRKPLWKSGP